MIGIIDGHYFLHRNLRQPELASLHNSEDLPLGGVFGFIKSLRFNLSKYQSIKQCVVVFDGGRSERRLRIYPTYKQRDESVDEAERDKLGWTYRERYDYQLEVLGDLLPVLGCRVIRLRGKEGDDVIHRITQIGPRSLYLILSDDRDMLLLVSDHVHVYRPMADQYVSLRNYAAQVGQADPFDYLMWKACAGDKREAPGVKGVGAKTLERIIPHCVSFADLREQASKSDDKRIRKIAENFDQVELSRELVDIRLEEFTERQDKIIVDILRTPSHLDFSALRSQLAWMEFHTLQDEIEGWIIPFQRLR